MEYNQIEILFNLYLDGKSSEQEQAELFKYIKDPKNEVLFKNLLEDEISNQTEVDSLVEEREQLILNKIFEQDRLIAKPTLKLNTWLKIAAAILIFALPAIYFIGGFNDDGDVKKTQSVAVNHDIMPGGNKAILILDDGTQIVLDKVAMGEIGRQGGSRIIKNNDGAIAYDSDNKESGKVLYNTMSTPRGGQYQLVLPDGTLVWLNAASSIRYPTVFVGNTREVEVTGEAYFEVMKDKTKPFHVKSGNQIIEVLGTHFNVNAYANESLIKTTLVEGSVRLRSTNKDGVSSIILVPNEQASFGLNRFSKYNVDPENVIAWKNGVTSFENENIKSIMRQIERWYDVEVKYQDKNMAERLFSGEIPRTATLSEVFRALELNDIRFSLKGKIVTVSL